LEIEEFDRYVDLMFLERIHKEKGQEEIPERVKGDYIVNGSAVER
jgi:hypothetical protein